METKTQEKYVKSFPIFQRTQRGDLRGERKHKSPPRIKDEVVADINIPEHANGPW